MCFYLNILNKLFISVTLKRNNQDRIICEFVMVCLKNVRKRTKGK